MRIHLTAIAAFAATWLGTASIATTSSDIQADRHADIVCRCEMHALVSYLKETAQLEGDWLHVEWHPDGSVSVCDGDFCQHIWCEGHEMHIEFGDAPVDEEDGSDLPFE